jgi:nondiscriminating glutamyl-tRNA synthetase
VGGARTALYNYLFAKKHGGKFIVRVEDTDEQRSTLEALKMQLQDLKWLGFEWDEGLDPDALTDKGPHAPYRQSQRQKIYQDHADQLLDRDLAFYCFLTDQDIDEQKKTAEKSGRPHQVVSPYRDRSRAEALEKIKAGIKPTIRFKTPSEKKDYVVKDLVRGDVTFPSDMVGDFVIIRSSGMPVYNFCCTIDDALMKITHVLRAEEHLSNTLRQMMLYEAFGYSCPRFGHLSIIQGPDRQKLSKRHGATSCNEYRLNGYLPEALLNFVALLGWSPPETQEILSEKELVNFFSLDRIHSSPAVFDEVKLKWVNACHLRALPHPELWRRLQPFLDEAGLSLPKDPLWQDRALSLLKTSMETLKEAVSLFEPLSNNEIVIDKDGREALTWPSSQAVITNWHQELSNHKGEYLSESEFIEIQDRVKNSTGAKGKFLFMALRVAVIGKPHGAEMKMLVPLIARVTLMARAQRALEI